MKKTTLLLLACVCVTQIFAQGISSERLDSILTAYTNQNLFMGSVLVLENGKQVLSKGYGYANREKKQPNTAQTPFCLASVSKQFTAMGIAILAEKGKLKFDDKLSTFIPDYPNGDKITVHQLLTHTSGIVNFTSKPDYEEMKKKEYALPALIETFKRDTLTFAPGSKFDYSNSGYILLSYIIEKASGTPLDKFMKKEIFEKLGMKNAGYYPKNADIPKSAARGYTIDDQEQYKLAEFVPRSVPSGAGGYYASAEDLLVWHNALNSEKLVSKATLARIFTPEKENYAYGWIVQEKPFKMYLHSGGIEGFDTMIIRLKDANTCIIVLRNCDAHRVLMPHRIMLNMMMGRPLNLPVVRKSLPISAEKMQEYVGTYRATPEFAINIFVEEGKLMEQASRQGKAQIYWEGEDKFFLKVVDGQIVFERDKDQQIYSLTLLQGGMKIPMKRE